MQTRYSINASLSYFIIVGGPNKKKKSFFIIIVSHPVNWY